MLLNSDSSPTNWRAEQLAKAIHVLQVREAKAGMKRAQ
jgi:hypothetical protein